MALIKPHSLPCFGFFKMGLTVRTGLYTSQICYRNQTAGTPNLVGNDGDHGKAFGESVLSEALQDRCLHSSLEIPASKEKARILTHTTKLGLRSGGFERGLLAIERGQQPLPVGSWPEGCRPVLGDAEAGCPHSHAERAMEPQSVLKPHQTRPL